MRVSGLSGCHPDPDSPPSGVTGSRHLSGASVLQPGKPLVVAAGSGLLIPVVNNGSRMPVALGRVGITRHKILVLCMLTVVLLVQKNKGGSFGNLLMTRLLEFSVLQLVLVGYCYEASRHLRPGPDVRLGPLT